MFFKPNTVKCALRAESYSKYINLSLLSFLPPRRDYLNKLASFAADDVLGKYSHALAGPNYQGYPLVLAVNRTFLNFYHLNK